MDYLIYLKDLNKCLSELEGLKENVTELANTATEDLSNISGTEINRLYESITALFTRLSNGYNNCFHWLDDYAESFEELEKLLLTQDSFGTLEERKKDIDRLKIENDKIKKMTPEEKRAYFEEKRRKRHENKGK